MGTGAPYPPATTPTANTNATTFAVRRSGPVFSGYEVRVGLLRFDTSALPDGATVTGATLRLYVTDRESDNGRSLVGEWYSAANWPIDATDYALNAAATAHAGTPIKLAHRQLPEQLRPPKPHFGLRTGFTGLRLHVDAAAPNGENNVFLNSFEKTTTTAPNPNSPSPTRIHESDDTASRTCQPRNLICSLSSNDQSCRRGDAAVSGRLRVFRSGCVLLPSKKRPFDESKGYSGHD